MLSPSSATVVFATQFTQVVQVLSSSVDPVTGESSSTPSTTVPVVTASFTDPGVTITPAVGQVTIAGQYKKIIPISWTYIDTTGAVVTKDTAPDLGTFKMIVKVDSPPALQVPCIYTIDGETFTHTVDLVSYSTVADKLKSLLASVS